MTVLNQEHLEQALKLCASEPIHQLGHIQPHGAVLVLSAEPQFTIVQASDNIHDFIGLTIDEVLDKCNGQVKQDTLLNRLFIKFPLILNRGLIA